MQHKEYYTEGKPSCIKGRVIESDTKESIIGAQIKIGSLKGSTDVDGNYFIGNLPNGKITLEIICLGYRSFKCDSLIIKPNTSLVVDVEMASIEVKVQEI